MYMQTCCLSFLGSVALCYRQTLVLLHYAILRLRMDWRFPGSLCLALWYAIAGACDMPDALTESNMLLLVQRLSATASPEQKAKLLLLKDDPELRHVFEDIQSSGAEVMEKYWCVAQSGRSATGIFVSASLAMHAACFLRPHVTAHWTRSGWCTACRNDTELMSKIAAKMGELNMGPAKRPTPSSQVCQMGGCWQHVDDHLSACNCSGERRLPSARDLDHKNALRLFRQILSPLNHYYCALLLIKGCGAPR